MSLPFVIHHNQIFAPSANWVNTSFGNYRTKIPSTVETYTLDSFAGDQLRLNGVEVGGINNIPTGFKVESAGWSFKAFDSSGTGLGMPVSRTSAGSDGSDNRAASGAPSYDFAGSYPGTITIIELFTDELHAEFDIAGSKIVSIQLVDGVSEANFLIGGNYDIVNFSFDIPTDPVRINDTVQITGTDALDEVDSISLVFEDPSNPGEYLTTTIPAARFTTQTSTLIEFTLLITDLPIDFEDDVFVFGEGNGTQFSGTIKLGQFAVLIADASGLYVIVQDKLNDTLYISSHDGDNTEDVAIPDPFIRTAYIGG